jgi:hypothetical protein
MIDTAQIVQQLADLKAEHRDLDAHIAVLTEGYADELTLKRMKKRKLQLKDMIAYLESKLIPDQPA